LTAAAYEAVSRVGAGWHQIVDVPAVPAAAAAAAMSAARLATAGHVADIPQRKRNAKTFASVKRGTT
jgi:cation transporter-like permease